MKNILINSKLFLNSYSFKLNLINNNNTTYLTRIKLNNNNLIKRTYSNNSNSIYISTTTNTLNSIKMTGIKEVLTKIIPHSHSRTASTDATSTTTPVAATTTEGVVGEEVKEGPTKNELKKLQKEKEKAQLKAEKESKRLEKEAADRATREANDVDYSTANYGKLPLNMSQERSGVHREQFSAITPNRVGEKVVFRARLQTSRAQGAKMVFFMLRQQSHTIQALVQVDPTIVSKKMVKFAEGVNPESIVLVEGILQAPIEPVKSCTIQDVEVKIEKIHVISEAPQILPFPMADASRAFNEEGARVALDTRLDHRVLDLRTVTNQAVFSISSGINNLFREFLNGRGFIEIHTPKLQAAATESGASVFKVSYFKGIAYLAQSPQLAKQMCIAADMEKVYEIGPVFRAENSYTHRHMTEFIGLDLEMTFEEHYHEVMETIDEMLKHIFTGLSTKYATEIQTIKKQFPHEEFVWREKTLVLSYSEAIKILQDEGVQQLKREGDSEVMGVIGDHDDMSTATEKTLGGLVKKQYGTDYYIIDKFPASLRPFYTMADPTNPLLSNSYDFFMRGEEILSGAQRVHDADMLEKAMIKAEIKPEDMKSYLDAFKLGMPPHAGGGIGLERVVMLFLKLENIRRASLFPRDPKRLEP